MIIDWIPITKIEAIPPMGVELMAHLETLKGAVKHASCSAWNLLYKILLKNDFPVPTVSFTDTGKPYFLNSAIRFSLSHSHGVCAVAVADRLVGVDVEIVKEYYPPHMIERSLSENEKVVYDGDFTRIWCRKEAVAKMTGEGITGYPSNIDTTSYTFHEQQFEWDGQKYWLVVVCAECQSNLCKEKCILPVASQNDFVAVAEKKTIKAP